MLGRSIIHILAMLSSGAVISTGGSGVMRVKGVEGREYECPDRFIRLGNSCYHLSDEKAAAPLSWRDAHFACTDMAGSRLAEPAGKWEDIHLKSLLNMHHRTAQSERWIGGIWNWEVGRWMWGGTGTPLKYRGFPRRLKGRWKGRKDVNKWHCIAMDPTIHYRWKSASCLDKKHFVCQTTLRKSENGI